MHRNAIITTGHKKLFLKNVMEDSCHMASDSCIPISNNF